MANIITIDPQTELLTFINTFTVAPDRAEELINLLAAATEETMRHMPGFISASLHISDDRKHVANYAQWRSRNDFDSMLKNAEAQVHMRQAATIADSYLPLLYTLRDVHLPA